MSTWTETVLAKLAWMRAVDLNRNEFGASTHQYRLADPISNDELEAIETQNGFTFPPSLREFWLHAGAGGAGPHLGALGPLLVTAFRPSEPKAASGTHFGTTLSFAPCRMTMSVRPELLGLSHWSSTQQPKV
jgi:hypothetical protein